MITATTSHQACPAFRRPAAVLSTEGSAAPHLPQPVRNNPAPRIPPHVRWLSREPQRLEPQPDLTKFAAAPAQRGRTRRHHQYETGPRITVGIVTAGPVNSQSIVMPAPVKMPVRTEAPNQRRRAAGERAGCGSGEAAETLGGPGTWRGGTDTPARPHEAGPAGAPVSESPVRTDGCDVDDRLSPVQRTSGAEFVQDPGCSRRHRPASVHAANRRCAMAGEVPNVGGCYRQAQPPVSTYTTGVKTFRSATGTVPPPCYLGRNCGISGPAAFHNPSEQCGNSSWSSSPRLLTCSNERRWTRGTRGDNKPATSPPALLPSKQGRSGMTPHWTSS